MRRKKLWRMLSIGLCSVMLLSSFSVYADTYDSSESSEVGGIETPGGADLEELFKDNSTGDDANSQSEENNNNLSEEGETATSKEDASSQSEENNNLSEEGETATSEEASSMPPDVESITADNTGEQSVGGVTETSDSESSEGDSSSGSTDANVSSENETELEYFPNGVTIDLSREHIDVPDGAVMWGSDGIATLGLNESTRLPVTHSRFDWFAWSLTSPGTRDEPGTGMGIKYIQGDPGSVDAEGNYRLAYCLNMFKDSPGLDNGASHNMDFTGWTNRKIAYVLFYGPLYWGETARWAPYSTGNWKFDYWVTQMAVHILNGEITYDALWGSMFGKTTVGGASYNDKVLVMDKLRTIINDANNMDNYSAFDSDYWINFSKAVFNCSAPASDTGFWYDSGSNSYVLNGSFSPTLTMKGQDWHHRASYMAVNTNVGYINHWGSTTMHQFALHIPKAEFEQYQRTGKSIRITVDLGVPRRWGGAIYNLKGNNKVQPITLLSFESGSDIASFHKEFNYNIPKTVGRIGVNKTSGNTTITNGNGNYSLKGAVYTVYKNSGLTDVVGTITTDANGNGWLNDIPLGTYYIKETKASPGYNLDTKTYTVEAAP